MKKIILIALSLTCSIALSGWADNDNHNLGRHNEATVAQLQAEMASGHLTSVQLTLEYIARIIALDQHGPGVNSVIELNPDALALAVRADNDRRHGHCAWAAAWHSDFAQRQYRHRRRMQTSAGSFALVGQPGAP